MLSAKTLLLAVACLLTPTLSPAAGVRVLFDPASPSTGPYPADALTVPDSQQKTGLRIHLPLPDCSAEPSTCKEIESLNVLDGFNLRPRGAVRFSAPVNLHSVEQGVYLVWLENLSSDEQGLAQQGHITQINQVVLDPASNTAYFKPNEILDQHRRYLLVVTDEARDTNGDPLEADPAFATCVNEASGEYCSRLAAAIATLADSSHVVGASVFTTLSATAWIESARRRLAETPTNFRRAADNNAVPFTGLASITLHRETALSPQQFEDLTVPAPSLLLPNLDRAVFGIYQSPNYLSDDQMIPSVATAGEIPAAGGMGDIAFHILLPKVPPPIGGYPVAIFGHGLGDNSFGASTIVGNTLAAAGIATIAINAVGHGGGPDGTVIFKPVGEAEIRFPMGGRTVDLNADGHLDAFEGCILYQDEPLGLRDCLRQTAVDLMQLVRLIREHPDVDGAGGVPLDATRIYYAGQSLGSLYGSLLNAVEPDVRAAALNVGGGSVVDIARTGDAYRGFVSSYLSLRNPPLVSPGQVFDDNFPLRNVAPVVNDVPGAIAIQELFERAEWRQMPGDPLAFAPHFERSTLPGVPVKRVLFQIARGDMTVPNPQNSALIAAAGLRESTQEYRHDLAREAIPTLPANPHSYLVEITNLFGPAARISAATQEQIARYFVSDGMEILDANVRVQDLFTFPIFQTPRVLPDDLGDDTLATTVSAASFEGPAVAPASIASVFGNDLAAGLVVAEQLPLPTILGNTEVRIVDSTGRYRFGELIVVSPQQVNLVFPADVALGPAEVVVANGEKVARGVVDVEAVSPALFSADFSGGGPPPAVVTTRIEGSSRTDGVVLCSGSSGTCTDLALTIGDDHGQDFWAFFGTGFRGHAQDDVSATIGGESVPVTFAGDQGQYAGLDQVNVGPIPRSLAGKGEVPVVITVSGKQANAISITIQ